LYITTVVWENSHYSSLLMLRKFSIACRTNY